MSDADRDRRLAEAFREAHRADQPPPFASFWRAGAVRQSSRRGRRIWVPALAALVLVLIGGGIAGAIRIRQLRQERELAEKLAVLERSDPLAFLLETPSQELLRSVPTFDVKGEWP